MKPHPEFAKILAAVKSFLPHKRSVNAVYYRCVENKFAHEMVSGEGARVHGGRWNPIGSFPAVYLSDSAKTALEEFLARVRRMKLPDHKALPMEMAGIEVKAGGILDLDNPEVAAVLEPLLIAEKVHWRTIQSRREAVSQAIGRAAREACFQGLIASSQQLPDGKNIVIFPSKLGPRDKLFPLGTAKLP